MCDADGPGDHYSAVEIVRLTGSCAHHHSDVAVGTHRRGNDRRPASQIRN